MQFKRLLLAITFSFNLLLPSLSHARPVSIPDPNLAAAIREEIGNAITTQTILNLTRLDVPNRGIKNSPKMIRFSQKLPCYNPVNG